MSGTDGLNLPPVAVQKSEIGSTLNSTLMGTFLMGIYTVIYFGILYIDITSRRATQGKIVITTMSLLYLLGIAQLSIQWYLCCWNFVGNGDTRDTVFVSLFDAPVWTRLAINVASFAMCILADGLLIWRCFHVWNRSKRVISFLLLLFISEIGLTVTEIMVVCVQAKFRDVTAKEALTLNALQSALYFVSFSTTIATTLLILYRIYSVSRDTSFSSGRFNHVIEMVVQSGALYACAIFVAAIAAVVPDNGSTTTQIFALCSYTTALLVPVAGIAPTIMIARVSWDSAHNVDRSSLSLPASNLQFQAHQSSDVEWNHGSIDDSSEIEPGPVHKGDP